MITSDIIKYFKVFLDKNAEAASYGGSPAFLPEEVDLFLNTAYVEVLMNKFTGNNSRRIAFEGDVKRLTDLQKLVTTDKKVTGLTLDSNQLTLSEFTGDKKRMLLVGAVLHFGDNAATCVTLDHLTARRFKKTYNNDPWVREPIVTLEDDSLKLYIDGHKMVGDYSIDVTYVKYPDPINQISGHSNHITEVPDHVLMEVINRAVVLALDNIESQRTGTKLELNNIQE